MKTPYMPSPCGGQCKCPFRKDCLEGWLGEERARELATASSFLCHKDHTKQCAGHMILTRSVAYRIVRGEVGGRDLVFDSIKDFINHHSNVEYKEL
jgi:hypothetical protein